jgi:hypothetical protein
MAGAPMNIDREGTSGPKAIQRHEEIALQFQEREQQLDNLQYERNSVRRPTSSILASSEINEEREAEVAVANQIEELKREVRELQILQRQVMEEIHQPTPPRYTI